MNTVNPQELVVCMKNESKIMCDYGQHDCAEFYVLLFSSIYFSQTLFLQLLIKHLASSLEDPKMFFHQLSSSETSAEAVWKHYNIIYKNVVVFSSLYGLRSSSSASVPYETFNCLTLPVPEADIHVKVNVFISVSCVITTEQKESLKYKEIAQKSVVCILEPQSTCEHLYDQMAASLNKSKKEIDLILCCRESRIKVFPCDIGEL